MKHALQKLPNGETRMVDANGNPLGQGDADQPVLHICPQLFVPAEILGPLSKPYEGLICEEITLTVSSTLNVDVQPEGGIEIRQPYPNRRYFIGGSKLIRMGWIIPLPPYATEFDLEFEWNIESPALWEVAMRDAWLIRHLIHIKLHPGQGMTYSMDSSCWPERKGQPISTSPVTILGLEEGDQIDRNHRQIIKDSALVYADGGYALAWMKFNVDEMAYQPLEGEVAGFFLEEEVDITGVPLEQVWSIDAFQDEQLHEVEQTTHFTQDVEAHRANGPVEMPAELFVKAVKLAEEIPFGKGSNFEKSIAGVPGGMEQHPALKLLCDWWETVRPQGEPFRPGAAMPLVRVRDDGEYWWGYYEIPNSPVASFNPSGRDVARIGDVMLVLFQAVQESAIFDQHGMTVMLPSGEKFSTIGIDKEQYLSGESDEAWYCLKALASFRGRFPSAWQFLNVKSPSKKAKRKKKQQMRTWNVWCGDHHIGTVEEVDEANAGCAALSKFGLDGEEWGAMSDEQKTAAIGRVIPPGAGISVSPA